MRTSVRHAPSYPARAGHAGPRGPAADLLDVASVVGPQLEQWRSLAVRARHANPFHGPDMVLPAVRHLAGGARVRLLLVSGPAGEARVALPVAGRQRFRRLPVAATTTWQHTHHFLGTPLVDPAAGAEDWRRALHLLQDQGTDPWLVLPSTDLDVARDVEEAARRDGRAVRRLGDVERAASRFEGSGTRDGDPLVEVLPGKRRKELRRVRRRLEEAVGGGLRLVDLAAQGRAAEGLEAFVRLEAAGWKGVDGGALDRHRDQRAFFLEACSALADRGALHVWSLEGGAGRPVAMAVDLREGATLLTYKTTYDESHAAHSPGLLLAMDQLRAFHASGGLLLDTCAEPGHPMAERLHPDRRRLVTLAVSLRPGRGVGAAVVAGAPHVLAARDRLRRRLDRGAVRPPHRAPDHAPATSAGPEEERP